MKTLAKLVILNLVGKIILQIPQIEITFPIPGLHLTVQEGGDPEARGEGSVPETGNSTGGAPLEDTRVDLVRV